MDRSEFTEHNSPHLVRKRAKLVLIDRLWRASLMAMGICIILFVMADIIVGQDTRAHIADCTTPGGKCFEDGQKSSQKAIQTLIDQGMERHLETRRIILIAIACAKGPDHTTLQEIARCVEERMEKEGIE